MLPDDGYGWRFIDLAELGSNTWRSYVATLLRVILLPLAFLALTSTGLAFAAGGHLDHFAAAFEKCAWLDHQ